MILKMMTPVALLGALLSLTACDNMMNSAERATSGVRDSYDATRYRMAQYIYHTDTTDNEPIPVLPPSTFCYKTMMDIVCYDRPRPDLHLQLVAVQGDHAYRYEDFLPKNVLEQETSLLEENTVYAAAPSGDAIISQELGVMPEGNPALIYTPSPSVVDGAAVTAVPLADSEAMAVIPDGQVSPPMRLMQP